MKVKQQGHGPLGKTVGHSRRYDPQQLFSLPRATAREELNIAFPLPFGGEDIWNIYELSWLGRGGLPQVAMATIRVAADSANIVESKSMKLYCNSFNMSKFASADEVRRIIEEDLTRVIRGAVRVSLILPEQFGEQVLDKPEGTCIDLQDIDIDEYTPQPGFLHTNDEQIVRRKLYSNLLRTNCPVTGQPDWATVMISYTGRAIDETGLLRYLVSFRQHTGFHENCVERIYMDILEKCIPEELTVRAQFTRRGGIDINPVRSTLAQQAQPLRFCRQ